MANFLALTQLSGSSGLSGLDVLIVRYEKRFFELFGTLHIFPAFENVTTMAPDVSKYHRKYGGTLSNYFLVFLIAINYIANFNLFLMWGMEKT